MTAANNNNDDAKVKARALMREAVMNWLHRDPAETFAAFALLIQTHHDPHEMVETLRPVIVHEDFPDSVNNRAMASFYQMADAVLANRRRTAAAAH